MFWEEWIHGKRCERGVGVVGYGLGGRVCHAPFVSAVPGLRLVAIMTRNGEKASKLYPATKIVSALEDILGDKSIELVVISTPNETHFALAKKALEAGKNIVIDKPFAPTAAEALELLQLAKSKGVLAIPFHNRRWDGDFLTVKKLLKEAAIGRLVTYESHFDRFRPIPRENTWKEAENPANGMLFDLGPHLVDQALALFGAPDAITASVRADRDQTAIEDAFDITLHYTGANAKGLLAHCRTSYLACINAPRFLLHGTKGSFLKWRRPPGTYAGRRRQRCPSSDRPKGGCRKKKPHGAHSPSRRYPPIPPCWSSARSKPNSATIAAITRTCATRCWEPPN